MIAVTLVATAWALALSPATAAHDRIAAGPVMLTVGWAEEPPLSGFKNAVEVDVSTAAGVPVSEVAGPPTVEVSFGDEAIVLPLLPAERQGSFQAVLVPTRPGVYTFHVMGTVKKRPINATSTCSEATFECVVDASDVQFPAKEPSSGQLADRIERALPRAERAVETADESRRLALAGAVFAVLALITAAGVAVAVRRMGKRV